MSPLPHLILNVGPIPNNLNLYRCSGRFNCPLSSSFRRRKATCSVYTSTPRLGCLCPYSFFSSQFFLSLRRFNHGYNLQQCAVKDLSFQLLPNLGLRHTVIGRTFTPLLEQFLHSFSVYSGYLVRCQPHFQLSSTFPRNDLGNVVLGLVARLEFWRFV